MTELLRRCDRYLDVVPAQSCDAVDCGPLRAFVSRRPWPYYARPRPELDLSAPGAVTLEDVRAAAEVLRVAGQPTSFEWIDDLVPSLGEAALAAGLHVTRYPLLALDLQQARPGPRDTGFAVSVLGDGSADLPAALATNTVGFATAGTAVGAAGPLERDALVVAPDRLAHVRERLRAGQAVLAVATDPVEGIVATGMHQPAGADTEVVGVTTLPSHRRRGAAAAVVDRLLTDAAGRGCTLALLYATDDDVARQYERLGFRRIGTAAAAETTVADGR